MKSERSKRLRYSPPELGVLGSILVRRLQRNPRLSWPVPALIAAAGLSMSRGWPAVARLYELGLIERRSEDATIRVILTARGRRYVTHHQGGQGGR